MAVAKSRILYQQRLEKLTDEMAGAELERVRSELVRKMMSVDLSDFADLAVAYWREHLRVDRVFICDMKDGQIIAGWKKGKNIIKLADWDDHYKPLEDDQTLQQALESDELVASPVEGEGADLAFSMRLGGRLWLAVFDQTDIARYFTFLDMAIVRMVRDLLLIKARMTAQKK